MFYTRLPVIFAGLALMLASCQSSQNTSAPATAAANQSNFHKIVVQEVLQTSQYTYLRARENGQDVWVAVNSMQAKPGDTYYYESGLQMTKFESKELNRVFESIILLDKISTEPNASSAVTANTTGTQATAPDNYTTTAQAVAAPPSGEQYKRTPPTIEKKSIKISAAKGGITIGELYGNKDTYAGKTVKIKGKVTKYTPAVMGKNWIHIQDGTEGNGKFDLAITSDAEAKVGDEVTFEGKIALNKDLGYGYFFDVIMEEASLKQ